jgi:elongation factor P
MYTITDLKPGRAITLDGDPYLVIASQFGRKSQSKANMQCKLKNLKTGAIMAKNFQGSEKIEPAEVGYRHVQYLYAGQGTRVFMDLGTYDQFELPDETVGEAASFLIDGLELDALVFDEKPIGIQLPVTIVMKVVSTEPGLRGDTAQGGDKPAKLESGATISVPLFINEGDKIKINTERWEYVERANDKK